MFCPKGAGSFPHRHLRSNRCNGPIRQPDTRALSRLQSLAFISGDATLGVIGYVTHSRITPDFRRSVRTVFAQHSRIAMETPVNRNALRSVKFLGVDHEESGIKFNTNIRNNNYRNKYSGAQNYRHVKWATDWQSIPPESSTAPALISCVQLLQAHDHNIFFLAPLMKQLPFD